MGKKGDIKGYSQWWATVTRAGTFSFSHQVHTQIFLRGNWSIDKGERENRGVVKNLSKFVYAYVGCLTKLQNVILGLFRLFSWSFKQPPSPRKNHNSTMRLKRKSKIGAKTKFNTFLFQIAKYHTCHRIIL